MAILFLLKQNVTYV